MQLCAGEQLTTLRMAECDCCVETPNAAICPCRGAERARETLEFASHGPCLFLWLAFGVRVFIALATKPATRPPLSGVA